MKNIFNFKDFVNESSAAGNNEETFIVPFKFSSNDPKFGYNSKTFTDDLKTIFLEKPHVKKEILKFLKDVSIFEIDHLEAKPFSFVSQIIPNIEEIIERGNYEPESIMPGGAILFIRGKKLKSGKTADFYLNKRGTKIEVVSDDSLGEEQVERFYANSFPYEKFEFNEEEKKELQALLRGKASLKSSENY